VNDVTEFNANGQKLCLSTCMDFYNGEIIAHRMAKRSIFKGDAGYSYTQLSTYRQELVPRKQPNGVLRFMRIERANLRRPQINPVTHRVGYMNRHNRSNKPDQFRRIWLRRVCRPANHFSVDSYQLKLVTRVCSTMQAE
jgi:hypothetical protein